MTIDERKKLLMLAIEEAVSLGFDRLDQRNNAKRNLDESQLRLDNARSDVLELRADLARLIEEERMATMEQGRD